MKNFQLLEYLPYIIIAGVAISIFFQIKTSAKFLKNFQERYQNYIKENGKTSVKKIYQHFVEKPQFNPFDLKNNIADNAANKEKLLEQISTFKKIKKKKEIMPGVLDLTILHKDKSVHQYRATIEGNVKSFKILQLTRYS